MKAEKKVTEKELRNDARSSLQTMLRNGVSDENAMNLAIAVLNLPSRKGE